jgi:hypothetical protein
MEISYQARLATLSVPSLFKHVFRRLIVTCYDNGTSKVDRNDIPILFDPLGEGHP